MKAVLGCPVAPRWVIEAALELEQAERTVTARTAAPSAADAAREPTESAVEDHRG